MSGALLATLLGLAAQPTAEPAAPARDQTPVTIVNPDWLKKPKGEDLATVWPMAGVGRDGAATIRCRVSIRGQLYKCVVVSETPPGLGFGGAAILLASRFEMKPLTINGRPAEGYVAIPIQFKGRDMDTGLAGNRIEVIVRPVWRDAPSAAEVAAAYPKGKTQPAQVVLSCAIRADKGLRDCDIRSGDMAFRGAARRLAERFRLDLPADQPARPKLRVNLPIHFGGPGAAANRPDAVRAPQWRRVIDPAKLQALFPQAAADAGLRKGRGVAECVVAAQGEIEGCRPKSASPEGFGFAEAAVLVVDALAISPWTGEGQPAEGAKITVPVNFVLADAASAPALPR